MKRERMTLHQAMVFLRERREVSPNDGFMKQLIHYEQSLFGTVRYCVLLLCIYTCMWCVCVFLCNGARLNMIALLIHIAFALSWRLASVKGVHAQLTAYNACFSPPPIYISDGLLCAAFRHGRARGAAPLAWCIIAYRLRHLLLLIHLHHLLPSPLIYTHVQIPLQQNWSTSRWTRKTRTRRKMTSKNKSQMINFIVVLFVNFCFIWVCEFFYLCKLYLNFSLNFTSTKKRESYTFLCSLFSMFFFFWKIRRARWLVDVIHSMIGWRKNRRAALIGSSISSCFPFCASGSSLPERWTNFLLLVCSSLQSLAPWSTLPALLTRSNCAAHRGPGSLTSACVPIKLALMLVDAPLLAGNATRSGINIPAAPTRHGWLSALLRAKLTTGDLFGLLLVLKLMVLLPLPPAIRQVRWVGHLFLQILTSSTGNAVMITVIIAAVVVAAAIVAVIAFVLIRRRQQAKQPETQYQKM